MNTKTDVEREREKEIRRRDEVGTHKWYDDEMNFVLGLLDREREANRILDAVLPDVLERLQAYSRNSRFNSPSSKVLRKFEDALKTAAKVRAGG